MGQDNSFIDEILETIDDFFAEEIGPVAVILCAESKDEWIDKLSRQSKRPSLRNVYIYVNLLAAAIDDDQAKKQFIDNVYSIKSLEIMKNR